MAGRAERLGGGRRFARWAAAWLRAPFRLFGFPGILAAVIGAGLVLAVAGGSAPLFVSAAGVAALRDRVGSSSSLFAGLRFESTTPISPDRVEFRERLIRYATDGLPLGEPQVTVIGSQATVSRPGSTTETAVQLVTRQGFRAHIQPVKTGKGSGFWIARSVADALHVGPGSTLQVRLAETSERVRVAGVYRDFIDTPLPPFWNPLQTRIIPPNPAVPIPPTFLLAEVGPLSELEGKLLDNGTVEVDLPLTSGLALPQGRSLAEAITKLQGAALDPNSPLNGAFASVDSGLPSLVKASDLTVSATTQPVQAISLAGRLVALVLVAAAGVYGVRRRRVEFELLSARGLGPVRLGLGALVEAIFPAALGAAAGWGVALVLVHALGPSGVSDSPALRSSLIQVALSAAGGILLFGFVAGAATRNEARERPGRLREAASRWPWEIAALVLAGASLYEILTRGAGGTVSTGQPPRFDLLILLFPFLFVAGTAGLLIRLGRGLLPKLRAAGRRRATWVYLATSRISSAPRLATTLVTASALAVGILVYAGVLASSVEATAVEKSTLSIGSDVVAVLGAPPVVPGHPRFAWTPVERFPGLTLFPSGDADLLSVEPSSFARAAYWNGRLGGSLQHMVDQLRADSGALPAIAVGSPPPAGLRVTISGTELPIRVVSHLANFPGAVRGRLTLVIDGASFAKLATVELAGIEHSYELWAKGDPGVILSTLRAEHFPLSLVSTAARIRNTPAFRALSWTFGLLEAFGVMAGLIAVLGMVLYLQARQQAREVSYALARRMGLARGTHRRSVLVELLAMLLVAFVLGGLFSTVGAALVHAKLDPIPNLAPGPFVQLPLVLFGLTGAAIILVCALGARLVQRRADRANVAEVMRLAG